MRPNKKLKKGQYDHLVYIILAVLLIFAFVRFYSIYDQKITGDSEDQICKSSVRIHAAKHVGDLALTTNADIKCPTQYETVNAVDKEKVMAAFAQKMSECWDMWGEGKLNLFPQEEGEKINYCVICHHLVFDNPLKISAREFSEYLRTTPLPKDNLLKEKRTYEEYFTGYSSKDNERGEFQMQAGNAPVSTYVIDTSIPYVTMFTYNKVGHWYKTTTTAIGAVAGVTVGVVGLALAPVSAGASVFIAAAIIGGTAGAATGYAVGSPTASDWEATIQIMPYELSQLSNLGCNYLPVAQRDGKQ